jgi:hypothetical protein
MLPGGGGRRRLSYGVVAPVESASLEPPPIRTHASEAFPVPDRGLFRDLQCVIDLNPQGLDGSQVLGSSHGVRAIDRQIEADFGKPLMYDLGVLADRKVRR